MKIWIGTSGFQYPEWKGGFYPADLSAAKMLGYYSERFDSTEINYSFRRVPAASTLQKWCAGTPASFKFSFKAPQKVTHFARLQSCADTLAFFQSALEAAGEKVGPVLFQLPPNFKKDAARLEQFLPDVPEAMRVAFEFRHASWFDDEVFAILRRRQAALCLAENEELTTPLESTADFGYLRLRREDYTPNDLERWAKFVREQKTWNEAFLYFKHEESGVGPRFGAEMQRLLAEP